MANLEIRLLGGFEVRRGEKALDCFESQKVRALLAYLACHPGQPIDRAHLASILWPEENASAGRQNLRQAVYNLKKCLGPSDDGRPEFLHTSHQSLQLDPEADIWVDVQVFEQTARMGLKSGIEVDIRRLTAAAGIYRGHLLPAFAVKGANEFDDWLWERREKLRELAVRTLRVLIGCHLENGDYALGIDHARSLVQLDPLSEEAHRTLIHLYFLAGRRSQALMQYETFASRLESELELEPLSDTRALYESILSDTLPGPPNDSRPDPVGPFVTMEGRASEFAQLMKVWGEVLGGLTRIIVIDGDVGVGKSRLAKSFLHRATSDRPAAVLRARTYDLAAPRVYGTVIDLLRNAWHVGRAEDRHRFHRLQVSELALLRELLPELGELEILDAIEPVEEIEDRESLFEAAMSFLLAASGPDGEHPRPVILFVDDIQWADPASLDFLLHAVDQTLDTPFLVMLTYRSESIGPEQLDALMELRRMNQTLGLTVNPIDERSVGKMVDSLSEPKGRKKLVEVLSSSCNGVPLCITETINYLCDNGHLISTRDNRWEISEDAPDFASQIPPTLAELIRGRIQLLPSSTRRLMSYAALIGQRFDFHLLRSAADEHVFVVETAMGLMLEHWLARQFPDAWAGTHQERDIVLWAQGARRGTFEFAHNEIRHAIHEMLPDSRKPILHLDIAEAIEKISAESLEEACEELAYHYLRAESWEAAVEHLLKAAERASRLRADLSAHSYCVDALHTLTTLELASRATRKPRSGSAAAARSRLYERPSAPA